MWDRHYLTPVSEFPLEYELLQIRFSTRPVAQGVVAVLVRGPSKWGARAAELDRSTGGQLTRACRATGFAGQVGEVCEVLAPSGLEFSRVLVVGVGTGVLEAQRAEIIGGVISGHVGKSAERSIAIEVDTLEVVAGDEASVAARAAVAVHLALGFRLRSYRFDRYRTDGGAGARASADVVAGRGARAGIASKSQQLVVVTASAKEAARDFPAIEAVAEGVELARDLVSEPPNVLHPVAFAARVRELVTLGVRVEVLGAKALRKLGFGALLGVAQGSQFEPQVVICEYDGGVGHASGASGGVRASSAARSTRAGSASRADNATRSTPLVLAGKGVTFDAGGINIKPSAGLETLKQDMGGAASIIGALKTLALRKARCHVVGICGLVENMPSGTAQRPGDVVVSHSGKTVEIINTDAEGRLVLCDLLWYAQERYHPKVIIDMATLTGAIAIALGEDYAGLFSNDDELAKRLVDAGNATGDRVWRYPMGESYDRQLDSLIADMKNLGADKGRSIIAAQFIQRFVQKGVTWAHVDFGMKVWAERDTPLAPEGATGFGVRLLDRLIADHFEAR